MDFKINKEFIISGLKASIKSSSFSNFIILKDKLSLISNKISYNDLDYIQIQENRLIVNTTPLGMYPKVELFPNLDFNLINDENYVYDLIYNPEITVLQKKAQKKAAKIKNGVEMLYKQAEISWNLWNK